VPRNRSVFALSRKQGAGGGPRVDRRLDAGRGLAQDAPRVRHRVGLRALAMSTEPAAPSSWSPPAAVSEPSRLAAAPPRVPCADRRLLASALAAASAGAAASVAFPAARFLARPDVLPIQGPSSLDVCADTELGAGGMRVVRLARGAVVVIRDANARPRAFFATCTHLGCTVRFRPLTGDLHCACHGARFDAATGRVLSGPASAPLPPVAVEVRHGRIVVGP
jgi:Rieske Fe-S protein